MGAIHPENDVLSARLLREYYWSPGVASTGSQAVVATQIWIRRCISQQESLSLRPSPDVSGKPKMHRLPRVKTPCIGVCSTGIGDSVCRGCKRFAHEVIHWNAYSEDQKRIVDARLAQFLAQCVQNRLRVIDSGLLAWQLQTQQIRHNPDHDPHCWLFALLKAGAGQITDPGAFGFEVDLKYRQTSLLEIREQIDQEYFALSSAHYERYHLLPDLFTEERAS